MPDSTLTSAINPNNNYGTLTITSGTTSIGYSNSNSVTLDNWSTSGYQYVPYMFSNDPISNLSNLNYEIFFSHDVGDQLKDNIISIDGKLLTFNCDFVEKDRIQPYELIMRMICEKIKFTITVNVSDILTLKYTGVQFKNIKNNFSFSESCDFSILKVKMKYKKIVYDNHKLHIAEKRKEKLEKIMEI